MNIEKFSAVLRQSNDIFSKLNFTKSGEIEQGNDEAVFNLEHENGNLKFSFKEEKLAVFNEDGKRIMYFLLPEDASARDIKYIVSEIDETLNSKYGEKTPVKKTGGQKKPSTVSKAAVKSGGSFYDEITLAKKLLHVFPELSASFEQNIARYDEFLAREFFVEHGTPVIVNAIKANKPSTMKKLFRVLNEMYEDGTNDLQSLIAVTILGELNNDRILLANCVDYMSETMAPPVIEVNKFLASSKGKRARAKMKNPPAYKPKKEKKGGLMNALMGARRQGLNNK